ncbi:DNA-3-methyladenine glycosylase [Labilibacter sediminis]|nr:DNA-3-methyladenine glycosylase [Labilibacter sediminis]
MRLSKEFFKQNALDLAPQLLGKYIVKNTDGKIEKFMITETEAYCGEEDLACHASKGRTKRTEVMYEEGGKVYTYIIYGIHWMLNVVCGAKNNPQAVLIRSIDEVNGPGRVGKRLNIDKSFYGTDLCSSKIIWIEELDNQTPKCTYSKRIGIDYAGEIWKNKLWRFSL